MAEINVPTQLLQQLLGLSAAEAEDTARVQELLQARLVGNQSTNVIDGRNHWTPLRLSVPTFSGYSDAKTPAQFLQELKRFGVSQEFSGTQLLQRVVPVALTGAALQWWDFNDGYGEWEAFAAALQREFGATNYTATLQRELQTRTQHPDEPLSAYVQAIAGYYKQIGGDVAETEKVRRAIDQMHPEFRRLVMGRKFNSLRELANAGPELQALVLRDRLYRPPPPAALSVEPRLAWSSKKISCESTPAPLESESNIWSGQVAAVSSVDNVGAISYAALDPFMYHHVPAWAAYYSRPDSTSRAQDEDKAARTRSSERKTECWACGSRFHFKRNCPDREKNENRNSKNEVR